MRSAALVAVAAAIAVLLGSDAALSRGSATRTLRLTGAVGEISADGGRVAAHVRVPTRSRICHRVVVWDVSADKTTSVRSDCVDSTERATRVAELTLAGARLLWVDYEYGNHAYCSVQTATASRPRAAEVAFCSPDEADTYVGHAAGDGPLLAFNSWYSFDEPATDITLWRLVGSRARKLRAAADAWRVQDVDGGRILSLQPNGQVTLFRADGSVIRTFAFSRADARSARLDGDRLVVRRGDTLQVHDGATGSLERTILLRGGRAAKFEDVEGGLAVYVVRNVVRVVRLADRRETKIAVPVRTSVRAQLEPPGLFYSYNVPTSTGTSGRISFVPWRELLRRL